MTLKEFSASQRQNEDFWLSIVPEEVKSFKQAFRTWFLAEFECSKMSYMHFRDRILHKSTSFNSWFNTKQQQALANFDRFGKDRPNRRDFESWKELIEHKNSNIELLSLPESSKASFSCKCLLCGNTFETNLLIGPYPWGTVKKCTHCFGNRTSLEKRIEEFIAASGIKATHLNRDPSFKGTFMEDKEIDIYLPELKIGFEVNGALTHNSGFTPFNGKEAKDKHYHEKKSQACLDKGISLFHVWEHWDEDKLFDIIKSKLKLSSIKKQARKLTLKSVSVQEERNFLEENHLEGFTSSIKNFALLDGTEIMQLISVRHLGNALEIARLASKRDTFVVGGLPRLLNKVIAFAKDRKYEEIISYSYRDLTPDPLKAFYHKAGFECIKNTGPMLFFFSLRNVKNKEGKIVFRANSVHSRLKFQKFKLQQYNGFYVSEDSKFECDKELTAEQNLEKLKIYPLYNSGCWKFVYHLH